MADEDLDLQRPWQTPQLRDDAPGTQHTVGWTELFFDLIFVVIIAVLADNLSAGEPLLEFAVQFTAIFWVWNGFTYYTERFESRGLDNHFFTFVAILSVGGLAIWGRDGLGANYELFAGSYLVGRLLNIGLWLRAGHYVRRFRKASLGFTGGFVVALSLIAWSELVSPSWRLVLFSTAVLIEILTPVITVRLQAGLPALTRDKYPERFGLFTLIVMGESVTQVILRVAATNEASQISIPRIVLTALGLLAGFGLWWVYFDFIGRRAVSPKLQVVMAWIYLHLMMLIGVSVIGVGLSEALAASARLELPTMARYSLLLGGADVLISVGLMELTLESEPGTSRQPKSALLKFATAVLMAGVALSPLPLNALVACGVLIAALGLQADFAWTHKPLVAGSRAER